MKICWIILIVLLHPSVLFAQEQQTYFELKHHQVLSLLAGDDSNLILSGDILSLQNTEPLSTGELYVEQSLPVSDDFYMSLGLDFARSVYSQDKNKPGLLENKDLRLIDTSLILSGEYFLSPSLVVEFSAEPGFFTDGAMYSNEIIVPVSSNFSYIIDPMFALNLGIASRDIIRNSKIIPLIGFTFKSPDQFWEGSLLLPLEGVVKYRLFEDSKIFGTFKDLGQRYNISNANSTSRMTVERNEEHLGVGLEFSLNKYIDISTEIGYGFTRSIDMINPIHQRQGLASDVYSTVSLSIRW